MIKKITKTSSFAFVLSLTVSNVFAQTCGYQATCEELGYTEQSDECIGQEKLKCPFDANAYWCAAPTVPTCKDGGYVDICPINQTGTTVVYYGQNCIKDCKDIILPILYSDMTIDEKFISDKTPIGIVFDINKKLAVALEKASSTVAFGGLGTDIPNLENCIKEELSSCNPDGKANTAAIIASGSENSLSYPAAEYCNTYTTEGTQAGDWFLPSYAELQSIYNAKRMINTALALIGKSSLSNSYVVSSTEQSADNYWRLYMNSGNASSYKKTSASYVYPVINYGNLKEVETTCEDGGYYTEKQDGMLCLNITYKGLACYRCSSPVILKTCEDGGYYTQKQDGMACAENIDGTGTVTYEGLTCYECIEKITIGDGGSVTKTTCEDLGYLTPGSTAACACQYGNKTVTATTSSGATKDCVRCGTYSECNGNEGIIKCFKCGAVKDVEISNPL